jgi:hypothetical protein
LNIIQQDTYNLHQSWWQRTLVRATGAEGKLVTLEIEVKRNAYDNQSHGSVRVLVNDNGWNNLIFVPLSELPERVRHVSYVSPRQKGVDEALMSGTKALYERAKLLLRLEEGA